MMGEHEVGPLDALPEHAFVLTEVDGVEVGVLRLGAQVVAFENRCPHQAGPVCLGEVVGRREAMVDEGRHLVGERYSERDFDVVCPWHGYAFDATTGENICDRRIRLRRWDVQVRDGSVFITQPGWREADR